jgi:1,4-dihydroxy-2-naphthoate polyprenyltransferase
VNYANDYSDGIRGTDRHRVGPFRLVGSGRAKPKTVLLVAGIFFGIAALAGLVITIVTGLWWLLAVGAVAILAAWFYTGGRRPYGYNALGELFVFVFFGLVATLGTAYVQSFTLNQEAWLGAVGVGLIAVATLIVNNIRDIAQDKEAGKRTLTVLLGRTASRVLYIVCLLAPFGIAVWLAIFYPIAWFALFGLLAALPAALIVLTARTPREYVLALKLTGLVQLIYGVALLWAFWK